MYDIERYGLIRYKVLALVTNLPSGPANLPVLVTYFCQPEIGSAIALILFLVFKALLCNITTDIRTNGNVTPLIGLICLA
jgi:hypothetical protein